MFLISILNHDDSDSYRHLSTTSACFRRGCSNPLPLVGSESSFASHRPPRPVPPSASASPPLSYRQTQVSHKFKKQSTTTSPPLNLTLSSNLSSFLPGAVAFESILATFRLFDYLITSNVPSAQLTGVNKTEHSPHPSILHRSVSTAPVAHEHPCCWHRSQLPHPSASSCPIKWPFSLLSLQ